MYFSQESRDTRVTIQVTGSSLLRNEGNLQLADPVTRTTNTDCLQSQVYSDAPNGT